MRATAVVSQEADDTASQHGCWSIGLNSRRPTSEIVAERPQYGNLVYAHFRPVAVIAWVEISGSSEPVAVIGSVRRGWRHIGQTSLSHLPDSRDIDDRLQRTSKRTRSACGRSAGMDCLPSPMNILNRRWDNVYLA